MSLIFDVGIGEIYDPPRKQNIVVLKNVPKHDDNRIDPPFRRYKDNKSDKEWFIYERDEANQTWNLRTKIFGVSQISAAQFVLAALWLDKGRYLINTGDNARTSYLMTK